jgi:CheY-like chemotaxis protein
MHQPQEYIVTSVMNLLLVEDDPDIQLVARAALRRGGFAVTVAASGPDAIDRVRTAPFDVILLDWMMPGMDGPEVCRRLKSDEATAGIPIIFLTARSQQREIDRGLALGAAGYIVKPFDALTLGAQVRDLLGAR